MAAAVVFLRLALAVSLATSLAACGSSGSRSSSSSGSAAQSGTYKIGAPYKIDGATYTPQEEFNRTETGTASWYGPGFHGKSTANGERYDQSERTAAHRTLQMPAIVKVTNLENGRSTVVRVNDRGPFARSRVIDLSRTAADDLDLVRSGTARVRIDQLEAESRAVKEVAQNGGGPSEQMAAVAQASSGRRAPAAAPAPVPASAPPPPVQTAAYVPPPAPAPAPTPATWTPPPAPAAAAGGATITSLVAGGGSPAGGAGGYYVQAGAFSTPENAARQRDAVASYGATEISQGSAGGRDVYRVRLGPYTTPDAAGIVAERLKRSGYGDARVVSN
ncbi:MAG: septal ring lytic transglycosylase RlpA family protein [Reyranellaceae bacterium]